jgi:hypothetical protein
VVLSDPIPPTPDERLSLERVFVHLPCLFPVPFNKIKNPQVSSNWRKGGFDLCEFIIPVTAVENIELNSAQIILN